MNPDRQLEQPPEQLVGYEQEEAQDSGRFLLQALAESEPDDGPYGLDGEDGPQSLQSAARIGLVTVEARQVGLEPPACARFSDICQKGFLVFRRLSAVVIVDKGDARLNDASPKPLSGGLRPISIE